MGVAYNDISSGSALFAIWKLSLSTEVHHFVESLTSSPLRKKNDYSVLVAIHQKWKGLRLIAKDSCMIHWLYAVSLTIIGTCSKLPAWNSVCLEQVNLRKKIELKVIKVASLDQVIFKYSGLQDRFGRIYHRLYICSVMINWTVASENCDKGYLKVLR